MGHSTKLLAGVFCLCLSAHRAAQILQTVELVPDKLPSFSTEATEPKYIVAIDTHGSTMPAEGAQGGRLALRDASGRQFTCQLSDNTTDLDGADGLVSQAGGAQAQKRQQQRSPEELLAPLDTLCLYRIEDWWTYELCYQRGVRQFHKEGDRIVSEYSLGTYNPERSDLNDVHEDEAPGAATPSKYVAQVYDGGQPCDITGEPRSTEVRYVCGEGGKDVVASITEAATCSYVLTLSTPRLCAHPAFQAPEPPVHHILCSLVGGSAAPEDDDTEEDAAAAAAEAAAGRASLIMRAPADDAAKGAAAEGAQTAGGEGVEDGAAELAQMLQDASRGLEVNLSALEAALAKSQLAQEVGGMKASGEAGEAAAEQEHAGAVAGGRARDVGPPMPPVRQQGNADITDEEEAEEEEADFRLTGMHAEL